MQNTPVTLTTFFPDSIRTVGGLNVRSVALIPVNVLRGTVTLMRVRGKLNVFFDAVELAADFANWGVWIQLQLVPVQNGAIEFGAILTPGNSADQESNKIIWQRVYFPTSGGTITSPGAIEVHSDNYAEMELDVKVKRRFARDSYALMLICQVETGAAILHHISGNMRALFSAADGL